MTEQSRPRRLSEMTEQELWASIDPFGQTEHIQETAWRGATLRVGDRVRLQPSGTADIFDSALAGKVGLVEAIEQDFEDQFHVAVVLEDDPGRDLGELRQPGHRFFFKLAELLPPGDPG